MNPLFNYTLKLADDTLIFGQRLGELCGQGPYLEEDIALTNIALDYLGQSNNFYKYAAQIQDLGKSEDDLAFLRLELFSLPFLLFLQSFQLQFNKL